MKVTVERLPESQVQLDIEIDEERLERSLAKVSRKLANQVRIPGFRPGKAPRHIIERHVGREGLIREALNEMIPDVYSEALESEGVPAVGQPELEITQLDPPRVTAKVPVRPTVELGDYREIRIEREPTEVTDEMVDEQLEGLRKRQATYVPVERPVQWNDVLIADIEATVEGGDKILEQEGAEFQIQEDRPVVIPGVAEELVGMEAGEERTFDLEAPEDAAEALRGKVITFRVALTTVKEESLPELDDDFAQEINAEEFETLDDLKTRIRNDLEEQMRSESASKLQEEALDALVEKAEMEFPRVLVDHEIDHMIREAVGDDMKAYQAHLQRIGRNDQEIREQFREDAERRVRRALVLEQLELDEDINVDDAEIESELDELVARLGEQGAGFKEQLLANDGLDTLRRSTARRRTLERLEAIVTGETNGSTPGTPSPEPDDEATPAAEPAEEAQGDE